MGNLYTFAIGGAIYNYVYFCDMHDSLVNLSIKDDPMLINARSVGNFIR